MKHLFDTALLLLVILTPSASAGTGNEAPRRLASDEALAAKLRSQAEPDFEVYETDHFTICHDTERDVLLPLVGRLEGTYDAVWKYSTGLDLGVTAPTERFGVILFNELDAFDAYRQEAGVLSSSSAGFYQQQSNLSVFFNTYNTPSLRQVHEEIERAQARLSHLRRSDGRGSRDQQKQIRRVLTALRAQRDDVVERFNRLVIQHEAAHQMLFNIGAHVRGAQTPFWLAEGLACQFEVPQGNPQNGHTRVNQMRLGDLRDALDVDPRAEWVTDEQLDRAQESGRFLPLRALICEDEQFTNGGHHAVDRYAQAWSLVYYLSNHQPEAFAAYIRDIMKRQPGERISAADELSLYTEHFGKPDATFEKNWIEHVLRVRYDRRAAGR